MLEFNTAVEILMGRDNEQIGKKSGKK